jgi:hypothetical protein
MLTKQGVHVSNGKHHHKYENGITEYLHLLAQDSSSWDEEGGDVESPAGWYARFGKHVIIENELGFVSHHKFRSNEWAAAMVAALEELDSRYNTYGDPESLDSRREYCLYVYRTAVACEGEYNGYESEDVFQYSEWVADGCPKSHLQPRVS